MKSLSIKMFVFESLNRTLVIKEENSKIVYIHGGYKHYKFRIIKVALLYEESELSQKSQWCGLKK